MMERGKILFVDDDEGIRIPMVKLARLRGFEIEIARDEKEAASKIQGDGYDVVVADMKFADRDEGGLEVIKKVKETHPLVAVIVLTAYASVKNVIKCMELGIFAYIDKREGIEALLDKIQECTVPPEKIIKLPKISLDEQKRYANKHVALINGKIIGSGETPKEAFEMAKREFPKVKTEDILLKFIPGAEEEL